MTKEQSFFIQILSDHLNGRETKCNDDLDWIIIHEYAIKHQVSGIVYTQANHLMPPEIMNTFLQETLATLYFASNRENDFEKVKKELKENDISFFVVKGPVIAELYPEPKLRVMGDIDLIIHREKRDECHNILLRNGYECRTNQDDREWQYYKNRMELELHDRLVYDEAVNEKGQDTFFNDCWKYVQNGQLDWNFHLLFLIFHLRKHFMNSGVGFRMFMDLALVAKKVHIDWYEMENNLKVAGMFEFARKCYGFIDRWFDIYTPLSTPIDDTFFEEATQKIFADGVFGFYNVDNVGSDVINQIRRSNFHKLGMLKIALKKVFPPYHELEKLKQYSYLKKSILLLPCAWIHRFHRMIKKEKSTIAIHSVKKSFVTETDIQRREESMRKWGLL